MSKISKDSFIKAVRAIISQRLINQTVTRSLKLCSGGDILFNSQNAVEDELVKLLEAEFDDRDGLIWEYILNTENGDKTVYGGAAINDETELYYALTNR